MGRMKESNWPAEPPTPRPRALLQAFRAAWLEFKRVRSQQRKAHKFPQVPF